MPFYLFSYLSSVWMVCSALQCSKNFLVIKIAALFLLADLLYKDYYFDHKFSLTTSSDSGLVRVKIFSSWMNFNISVNIFVVRTLDLIEISFLFSYICRVSKDSFITYTLLQYMFIVNLCIFIFFISYFAVYNGGVISTSQHIGNIKID